MNEDIFNNVDAWGANNQSLKAGWKKYLHYFDNLSPVLDVGCGRGAFLELLQENNISCVGIDLDSKMAEYCRLKGFVCMMSDAVSFLVDKQSCFGGIFCSHVIEHMRPEEAMKFIKLCHDALKPGGRLVLITPNPRNFNVISYTFWLDTTHVRPYPLLLLEKLFTACGFQIIAKGRDPQGTIGTVRKYLRQMLIFLRQCLLGKMFYDFSYDEAGHEIIIVGEK